MKPPKHIRYHSQSRGGRVANGRHLDAQQAPQSGQTAPSRAEQELRADAREAEAAARLLRAVFPTDFRVLVFGHEGHAGWTLCGVYSDLQVALVEALEHRAERSIAAVVRVTQTHESGANQMVPILTIVEANVPHPRKLLDAPEFRKVALAL